MTASERTDFLAYKYLSRTISPTEFDELMIWLIGIEASDAMALEAPLWDLWNRARENKLPSDGTPVNWEDMYQKVIASDPKVIPILFSRRFWKRFAAAAVFIVVGGAAGWLYFHPNQAPVVASLTHPFHDVAPGTTKAVLTLSDGSHIELDNSQTGPLAVQGKTAILHDNGELTYNGKNTKELLYNTLTTHRGEQSPPLILSDGTKVWLNAASSITFPVAFTGDKRQVKLTGEVYFEVAKNASKPFIVSVDDQTVEVLGTHFNINAYTDEGPVKTTLLEGSVKVAKGGNSVMVKPGEEAFLSSGSLTVSPANTAQAVAWKNGYFHFEGADLKAVLRQAGRWYDLDIVYEGKVTDHLYGGKLERTVPLSAILRFLKDGNIKYRLEEKTLIIE